MKKVKIWIAAARPRTLPLSIAGILMGTAFALHHTDIINWWIVILALITTLSFQILSNFANDYGDGVKGTDNEKRLGPQRALQSGALTDRSLKKGIILTAFFSAISAIALIYISLGISAVLESIIFLILGGLAIWAAIKYTVGDNAYGYRGLGDLFVFIFFGPVSVMGMCFLLSRSLLLTSILPSLTIGLLSIAVLNLNNMRDIDSDRESAKITLAVKFGFAKAKKYHFALLSIAVTAAVSYSALLFYRTDILWIMLPLFVLLPIGIHINKVLKASHGAQLDSELKVIALITFFYALLSLIVATFT